MVLVPWTARVSSLVRDIRVIRRSTLVTVQSHGPSSDRVLSETCWSSRAPGEIFCLSLSLTATLNRLYGIIFSLPAIFAR
jgi:hypothetical protein